MTGGDHSAPHWCIYSDMKRYCCKASRCSCWLTLSFDRGADDDDDDDDDEDDDDHDDRDDDGGGSSCGDIVLGPASLLLPSSLLTNACRCMYEYGYW